MRRVSAPGGRAVITTNAADSLKTLFDLYNEAAREHGAPDESSVGARFSLDDAALVREVFPSARIQLYHDAFVFREAEPVLAYVASAGPSQLSADIRARVLAGLERRLQPIFERDGVFRVPKTAGCFIADLT